MTSAACFCGCLCSFDGAEGPCPKCGAVAGVNATAIRQASHNREQSQPDTAAGSAAVRMPSWVIEAGPAWSLAAVLRLDVAGG